MVELAIHCGPIAGGYGCDMGELPAPPAQLGFVFYALAAAAMAVGVYVVVSGHLPIRLGKLKQIRSKLSARLIGLSLIVWSSFAAWLGWDYATLSQGHLPRSALGLLAFPGFIASLALQWWAYRIDRRRTPPSVAS